VEIRPLFTQVWFRLRLLRPAAPALFFKAPYVLWRCLLRLFALRGARAADLVVIEHQLFPYLPFALERWLLPRRTPWILEFDDAIYLTRFHGRKLARLMACATRVVVGNRTLAEHARRFQPAVEVVPTSLDLDRFPDPRSCALQEDGREGPLRVGWIGLPSNLEALKLVEVPLRKLHRSAPLLLCVLSSGPVPELDLPVEAVEWSEEIEVDWLVGLDVGIMPLPDSPWSRGKCALKALQYFAAGVPVVAAPFGVNTEIIDPGRNGYLARDEQEWFAALLQLARDPALRRRVGLAGRETVEAGFALRRLTDRIATLWMKTARGAS
jgi:hypothetical protein